MSSPPALTTIFSPASSCVSSFYLSDGQWILGPGSGYTSCFPSGWAPSSNNYFSPGICPFGYNIAFTSTNPLSSATETVFTCCPMYEASRLGDACMLTLSLEPTSGYNITTDTTYLTYPCASSVSISQTSSPVPVYSSTNLISTQTFGLFPGGVMHAFSIQVRFQPSDFAPKQTSVHPVTVTATATATVASPPQTLSPGAKAGIGVGVTIAVLALLLFGAILILRRRRHQRQALPPLTQDVDGVYASPELDTREVSNPRNTVIPQGLAGLSTQGENSRRVNPVATLLKHVVRESSEPMDFTPNNQRPPPQPDAAASRPSASNQNVAHLSGNTAMRNLGVSYREDGQDSAEEIQRQLNHVKAAREQLLRIHELSQLEAQLEAKLAATKSN